MKRVKRVYRGTMNPEPSEREIRNGLLARRAAEEGLVLLKNEGGLLPLAKGSRVALFGSGAAHTIKGGVGSGDVNERRSVSVCEGMRNAGFVISSEGWIRDYEVEYDAARAAWRQTILDEAAKAGSIEFFNVYLAHPWHNPEGREITPEDMGGAGAAVYVISRNAGASVDRRNEPGDYRLSERELHDLKVLAGITDRIAVVVNAGGPVDVSELLAIPGIRSILFISQPGMEGGNAVGRGRDAFREAGRDLGAPL